MSFIQAKTTFENITNQVWTNLEAAYDNELTFRETTISDLIFLYLKQQNLSYVILEPTKHSDEKHQGTDWEWWIGSPKLGWLRYSVQAKIYSSKSRSYESLDHNINKIYQIDILRNYSLRKSAIPIYALYNYVNWNDEIDIYKINSKSKKKLLKETVKKQLLSKHNWKDLGVTITPLNNIQKLIQPRKNKIKDTFNNFFYLHGFSNTISLPEILEYSSKYLNDLYYQKKPIFNLKKFFNLNTNIKVYSNMNIGQLLEESYAGLVFDEATDAIVLPSRIMIIRSCIHKHKFLNNCPI